MGKTRRGLILSDTNRALTIERARSFRKLPTAAEARLWGVLRNRRLDGVKFRRQHPLGRYVADFYAAEFKLVVEVDGPSHDQRQAYDRLRDAFFASQGIRVLRLRIDLVENDIDACRELIRKAMLSG